MVAAGREVAGKLALAFALLVDRGSAENISRYADLCNYPGTAGYNLTLVK